MIRRSACIARKARINPVSKRRRREMAEYTRRRKLFLAAHPFCQASIKLLGLDEAAVIKWRGAYKDVYGDEQCIAVAEDIHHTKGRGRYYLDESTWMAVSRGAHCRIHDNPSWARRMGLLA